MFGQSRLLIPVLLCAAVLLPAAVSGLCDCWHGTTTSTSPCTCSCPATHMEPYCAYTSADTPIILTSVTTPKSAFVSGVLEIALREGLGLTSTSGDVVFRIIDQNPSNPFSAEHPNDLILQWSMRAAVATQFLNDVRENTKAYLAANNITGANVNNALVAPKSEIGDSLVFYNADPIKITVNTIGWLIGICIVFCLAICECCCVTNSTANSQKIADEERLLKEQREPGVVEGVAIAMASAAKENPFDASQSATSPYPKGTAEEDNHTACSGSPVVCDPPNYVSDPQAANDGNSGGARDDAAV